MWAGKERGISGYSAFDDEGQDWERYSLGVKVEGFGAPRDTMRCLCFDSGFCSSRSSMSKERKASWTEST